MSIFDRYRTNEDDALELAKARAAAARRQPMPTPGPAVSAPMGPRSPMSPTVDPSKGKTPTPKPPAPVYDVSVQTPIATTPADEVDDLARTRAEREKERRAAEEELRLGKQRAVQQTDARAGLAGFGLSGATSAQLSNVARAQDRTATLTLADLDRRQRDEEFQAIQRMAALDDLEEAQDKDIDNDGDIAGRTPKDITRDEKEADRAAVIEGRTDADAKLYEQFPPGMRVEKNPDGSYSGYTPGSNYAFKMTKAQYEAYRNAEIRRRARGGNT